MAKAAVVIDITPEPQAKFSFLELAEGSAADIPTKGTGRTGDKVKDAKTAILAMIPKQKGYLDNDVAGREQPKTKSGDRTVSTWFTPAESGYWTNIRWGQRSLTINEVKGWWFSTAEKLHACYDALEAAIRAGELDKIIEAEANKPRAKKPDAPQPKLVEAAE